MTNELVDILIKIRHKVSDQSDMLCTCFETADELRKEIDSFIQRLHQNDGAVLKDIYSHFLPTSTFQEHSMQNGWTTEYMKLAEEFDKIYDRHK